MSSTDPAGTPSVTAVWRQRKSGEKCSPVSVGHFSPAADGSVENKQTNEKGRGVLVTGKLSSRS